MKLNKYVIISALCILFFIFISSSSAQEKPSNKGKCCTVKCDTLISSNHCKTDNKTNCINMPDSCSVSSDKTDKCTKCTDKCMCNKSKKDKKCCKKES